MFCTRFELFINFIQLKINNPKNAPKETKWSSKYGHWEEKPIDLTYDMAMEIAAIAAAYINTNPYSDDELDE